MKLAFPHTLDDRAHFEAASREAAHTIYIGDRTCLCWVADRFKMYVPSEDLSLAPHLMLEGYWEAWVSVCFARLLRALKPKSLVNVGANVGYYALLAAALNPDARIEAYEPQPKLARLVRRSAIINGFGGLAVHEVAVGAAAGTARLRLFGDYYGSAAIVDVAAGTPETLEVPLVALDEMGGAPIEALFIDAEGYEYEVMQGAARRIDAAPNCVAFLEFSAQRYAQKAEFVEFIAAHGFSIFQIDYQGGLKPLARADLDQTESVLDVVLIKGWPGIVRSLQQPNAQTAPDPLDSAPAKPGTDCAERIAPSLADLDQPPSLADLDQPPSHRGYLDGYADHAIYGWCLCATDPAAPVDLDIYLGPALVGTVRTHLPRPDIAAKLGLEIKAGFRFSFREAKGETLAATLAALAEACAEPRCWVAVKVRATGTALPLSPHFQITPADAAALAEALCAPPPAESAEPADAAAPPESATAMHGTHAHGQARPGRIETVAAQRVTGWINLDDTPAKAVELLHNGALAGVCHTFGERPDLAAAGIRASRCGFCFRLPPGIRLREGDRIEVRRQGTWQAALRLEITPSVVADSLRWHIEAVDEQTAHGWAAWGFEPETPVEIRLEADGVDLCGTRADRYREDLSRAGIHDGYHGFELALWPLPELAQAREIRLVEARHGTELWRGRFGETLEASAIAARVADGLVTAFAAPDWAREAWRSVARLPAACHAPSPHRNPALASNALIEHLFARHWQKTQLDTAESFLVGLLQTCAQLSGQLGGEILLPPALLEWANQPAAYAGHPATRLLSLYGHHYPPAADREADYPTIVYRFVVDVGLRWKLDRRVITPALWAVLMEDGGPLAGAGPRLPRLWHLLHGEEPGVAASLDPLDAKDRARLLALFGGLLFAPVGGLESLPGHLAAVCRTALDGIESQDQWADLCRLAHWPPHRPAWDASLGSDPAPLPCGAPRVESSGDLPAVRVFTNEAHGTGLGQNVAYTLQALAHIGARYRLIPCANRREHLLALEETRQGDWVNLFHVQPDNLPLVMAGLPETIRTGSRNIGFFMWELMQLAEAQRLGVELVDEIWTATHFTQAIFTGATTKPVHRVGHAVAPVPPSARDFRAELGLGGRFVFLFAFDAHSCLGCKNPAGVLAAFQRAFGPDPEAAHLIIKTANLAKLRGQPQPEAFMDAVAGCRAVTVLDTRLSAPDLSALMRQADAYVSLHRAEGFGYTAAEAMYFGRPVIATAYSGNVDFCTPETAALVDGPLRALRHDDFIYEVPGAEWAEPDIGQAAEHMRRLVADPGYARDLAAAGQAWVRDRCSVARLAERYRERLAALAGGAR